MNNREILTFYGKPIPKDKQKIAKSAKKIISNKFCRCVKKLESRYGERAIGICTKSVLNNKGLQRTHQFSCKPNKVSFIHTRHQQERNQNKKTKKSRKQQKTRKIRRLF